MIKRLLLGAALTLGLGLFQPAFADGPFGGAFPDPNAGAFDNNFKFLGISPASAILNNERLLTFSGQFSTTDNGAGLTYAVDLLTVPINKGGTNGITAQAGVNNLLGAINGNPAASGDVIFYNGTNWSILHKAADGTILTLVSGSPAWSTGSAGAPTTAQYIVGALDATLSAERVLTDGSGITHTDGGANGNWTIAVDSTVIRTTGAQSMAGPKTLSGGPIISGATSTGLVMAGTSFNTTVTIQDPAAARTARIPDYGTTNADFLMTQGAQTVAGVKTLSASPVLSTNTITGSGANTVTLFTTSDTVVGRATTDTLTNKTLTTAHFTSNSLVLNQSSANITVDWANPAAARAYHITERATDADFAMLAAAEAYVNGGVCYSNASTLKISAAGTSGQPLISGGTGAPAYNILGLAGGGTGAALTASNGGILYSGAAVMAINTPGTSGKPLLSGGAGAPTFGTLAIAGGGSNNAALGVSAIGIYNGDGSKIIQTTGTALQQFRVNSGATAIEAFTPAASSAPVVIYKNADESVTTSTTLQDDDNLLFSIGAGDTWFFQADIILFSTSGAPDFKFTFVGPASVTISFAGAASGLGATVPVTAGGGTGTADITGSVASVLHITGSIDNTAGSSGTFKLQWAQNVSNAAATMVKAGSSLVGYKQ